MPVEDYDVLRLHVLATRDADPLCCELSGRGLKRYRYNPFDTDSARASNVIHVVARGDDGAVLEWLTPRDVQLRLSPACVAGGLTLSYELCVDGDGWRVAYRVQNIDRPFTTLIFDLVIVIGGVPVWDGNIKV